MLTSSLSWTLWRGESDPAFTVCPSIRDEWMSAKASLPFPSLTGLDHCSYENCALPGSRCPALIFMSLTHVHLRVSDMRIMLRRTWGCGL